MMSDLNKTVTSLATDVFLLLARSILTGQALMDAP